MKKIIKKHPLAIRWFHWINFPVLAVMIWSGLLIYWANDVYRLGWGDRTVLKFFPDSFYKALHIPFRLAEGMSFHFVFMWLFAINGFIYVLFLVFSGEWRLIVPNKKSFMGLGSLLTGLSIYKPVQFNFICKLLGGYEWARAEHFIFTILFTLFFLVHIIQVIIAGWNNFRGMITGFEVVPFLSPLPALPVEEKSLPPEEKIIEPVSETIEVKEDDTIQGT